MKPAKTIINWMIITVDILDRISCNQRVGVANREGKNIAEGMVDVGGAGSMWGCSMLDAGYSILGGRGSKNQGIVAVYV